jgi:uncharacterized protein YndB with AHSA1/START domain
MSALVTRYVIAPVEKVFEAISDPLTYPDWLVGAKEIRSVDDDWPAPGSRFHHRVGLAGPLTIPDHSESLEVERPTHLALEVLARPLVRGRVDFRLTQVGDRRRIDMAEEVIGTARSLAPVLDPSIEARNRVSLNALVARLNEPD